MENNFNNENNLNLLKRLYAKFKTVKISKKVTSLVLVATMVLALAACDEVIGPNGEVITIPQNPGIQTPGTNPGNNNVTVPGVNPGTTDPGTEPGTTTPTLPERDPIDVTGHSELLQTIINDPYYDQLIFSVKSQGFDALESWAFQPHPYAFYEDQGIDLKPLKNGQSEAYTMSYVLDEDPNSLYMYTRILLENSYYQNYLLKYEITDAEYNDYYLMHNGYGEYDYYIQSVFMNNEIAKSRDPEIISSSKVSKSAQEYLTESFQKTKLTTTKNCDIFIMDIEPTTGKFVVYVVPRLDNDDEMHIDSNIAVLQCLSTVIMENGVYTNPTTLQTIIDKGYKQIDADVFLTQSARLGAVSLRDYENEENR